MVEDDNPKRNDLEVDSLPDAQMEALPPDEAQPWGWYNDGKRNRWLPCDHFSKQKYTRVKGLKFGKLDIESKPEPQTKQLSLF